MHYQSIVGCKHFFSPLCARVQKIDIGGLQALLLCNYIGSCVCSAMVDQALFVSAVFPPLFIHISV